MFPSSTKKQKSRQAKEYAWRPWYRTKFFVTRTWMKSRRRRNLTEDVVDHLWRECCRALVVQISCGTERAVVCERCRRRRRRCRPDEIVDAIPREAACVLRTAETAGCTVVRKSVDHVIHAECCAVEHGAHDDVTCSIDGVCAVVAPQTQRSAAVRNERVGRIDHLRATVRVQREIVRTVEGETDEQRTTDTAGCQRDHSKRSACEQIDLVHKQKRARASR